MDTKKLILVNIGQNLSNESEIYKKAKQDETFQIEANQKIKKQNIKELL